MIFRESPEFDSLSQVSVFPKHLSASGLIKITHPTRFLYDGCILLQLSGTKTKRPVAFAKAFNLAISINLLQLFQYFHIGLDYTFNSIKMLGCFACCTAAFFFGKRILADCFRLVANWKKHDS